jgi:glycerophosphoryl diester phosphodiesterase
MSSKSDVYTNIELKAKPITDCKYEQKLAQEVIMLLKEFPELRGRVLLSSFNQVILNEIRVLDANISIAMLLSFSDNDVWEESFLEFKENSYNNFQRLNCCAIGINIDYLTKDRVNLFKSLCFRVLGYANKKIDRKHAYIVLALGVDSVFIDGV